MKRAVVVQGLGFGDEGKGATVDFLTRKLGAELVVRYCGGSQAGHNVVLPGGRRHAFAQFGAGTLAGATTYLGDQMIIHPAAMQKEAGHLREMTGKDPFLKLLVHPRALVTTIYHQHLNRLRELARNVNRHGSCGHGIGEARRYWLLYGQDAVVAADLKDRETLTSKLELIRQRFFLEAQEFGDHVGVAEHWRFSVFTEPASQVAAELMEMAKPVTLQATLPSYRTAVFEGAQGVLLDEWRGFHPHTTWSTVTPQHAMAMVEKSGAEEVCVLGAIRAYMTRHGAGPLPTWSPELDTAISDPGNPTNAWQGTMRRGWLDLPLLRYAMDVAGAKIDGLAVNGLDELGVIEPRVCFGYQLCDGKKIQSIPIAPFPSLPFQQHLTSFLGEVMPIYETVSVDAIAGHLGDGFPPNVIRAWGPTWEDRVFDALPFSCVNRTTTCAA